MNLLLKNQRNLDKNILWLELLNTTDILHVQQGTCISACVRTGVNVTWQQYFHRVMAFCKLDVCGSVHHSTILTEKPNKMQQCIKILLFLILNEAQHVSGDTPPIIRSLKLHKQPLVLHTWKVVRRAGVGRCQVEYATWQRPTTARPTTFHICKTRGCLCSFRLLMMGGVSPETR